MAHPGGRPTDYTIELGREICEAIASGSKGLRVLCKENPHWPHPRNIYKWMHRHEEFRQLYYESKANQVDVLVDEIIEIADDCSHDDKIKYDNNGNEIITANSEWINRSRLRIETRKWVAAVLQPRKYGDKVQKDDDDKNDFINRNRDKL